MANYTEVPLNENAVPLPAAYSRVVSFNQKLHQEPDHNPNVYVEPKKDISHLAESESLKEDNDNEKDGQEVAQGKTQTSVLIFLRDSRIYIRVLAVLIMIISFSLIITAVSMFAKAKNQPGNPLDSVPSRADITDHPCVVFSGVAAMNLAISITILSLSWLSSKFRKSQNAVNAVFAIISAIGFGTSMGACFYLNKQTTLQNDLWKWSCENHRKGVVSQDLNFGLVCHVVSYGWKFGLVQASLELLTFIVSITAFVLLKYSYFTRYGRLGKVF